MCIRQTAGGLLCGVPANKVSACLKKLHKLGYESSTVIGEVISSVGVQAGGVFSTNHRKYGDEEYSTNDERAGFLNTGDSKAYQEFEQKMVRNYVSQYDDMVNRMNSETEDEFDDEIKYGSGRIV